ncbi:MAG: glycosyltransferase family 4 protein [Thermodesulfobacteriota bacterium]
MRIGIIRRRYNPYGGAEVFLKRFIAELLKRGHVVDLFAEEWAGGGGGGVGEGVTFHRVRARGPYFLRPLCFALNAKKAVSRARPDVVVSFERTFCQDVYRAGDGCHREWLERRMPAAQPLKRFLISINPLHRVLLYIERRLFTDRRLKKVVANSNMVKADIIKHYGLPEKSIYVIYNGINLSAYTSRSFELRKKTREALGVEEGVRVLLFVGSGFERKGLLYTIRALKRLKEAPVKLIVIGRGSAGRYLKEARGLGVEGLVTFLGPVKETAGYYQAADIFVLPSLYEPFSNACLEAMASGLPVVTSRANGFSEVIKEGSTGAVVEDPTDPEEIARKIKTFLPVEKKEEAGRLARREAEKFTIEKNVGEFLKIIEEARGDKG